MTPRLAVALLVFLGACATPRPTLDQLAPPQVILKTTPPACKVVVDGTERGTTPLVFKAPRRDASHVIVFSREGFWPEEILLTGEEVAAHNNQEVVVFLRPGIWKEGSKPVGATDPKRIARAGIDLAASERCPDAIPYLSAALALDQHLGQAHKALGSCYAQANQRQKAIEEYKRFLMYAPEDPDAARVKAVLDRHAGDLDWDVKKEVR